MRMDSGSGSSNFARRRSIAQNPTPIRLNRPASTSGERRNSAMDIIPASTQLSPSERGASTRGSSLPPLSPQKSQQRTGSGELTNTTEYHPAISNLSQTSTTSILATTVNLSPDNSNKTEPQSILVSDNLVLNPFGLRVKSRPLAKVQAQRKNVSPFNADHFLPMLKPCPKLKEGKITLALDIDETLVHASINPRPGLRYDTIVHIDDGPDSGDIYVAYRPHLHTFLRAMAPLFEVVVFTASQSCYADPLMDTIDPSKVLVTDRLYRDHCVDVEGGRIKDLNLCGRSLDRMVIRAMDRIVIVDNSPVAYCFQPRNAIPILSWFDDPNDDELLKLIPLLQQLATQESVYPFLDMYNAHLDSLVEIERTQVK